MTKTKLIVIDTGPNLDGSSAIQWLKVMSYRVQARLAKWSATPNGTIFFCNTEIQSFLLNYGIEPGDIYCAQKLSPKYRNCADFKTIHKFSDAVIEHSKKPKFRSLFEFNSLSLFEIMEARWIDPLFNECLWRLNFFEQLCAEQTILNDIEVFRTGVIGRMEVEYFKNKIGYRVRSNKPSMAFDYFSKLLASVRSKGNHDDVNSIRRECDGPTDHANKSDAKGLKILLVVGTINRTVDRLKACVPHLQELKIHIVLLAYRRVTIAEELRQMGVSVYYIGELITAETFKLDEIQSSVELKICDEFYASFPRGQYLWNNLELINIAEPYLRKISDNWRQRAKVAVQVADEAIRRFKPALILTFEESELPRTIVKLAKAEQIPTLTYLPLSPAWFAGLIRRNADKLATSGSTLKEQFEPWRNNAPIEIVGDTLIDNFVKRRGKFDKNLFFQRHNILKTTPLIGIISTTLDDSTVSSIDMRNIIENTCAVASVIGASVILKAHPLEDKNALKLRVQKWSCDVKIIEECDLIDFFFACDLLCSPQSSAVWSAMAAGTPVATFQTPNIELDDTLLGWGIMRNKGIKYISPDMDAIQMFRQLINHSSVERIEQIKKGYQHAAEHLGSNDGQNSGRLAVVISSMMGQSSRHLERPLREI